MTQPKIHPSRVAAPALAALALLAAPVSAQQGTLDTTFSGDGKAVVHIDWGGDLADYARDVVSQFDGSLVIVGSASVSPTDRDVAVSRLYADGSLDTAFGSGGRARIAFDLGNGNQDRGVAAALQSDGKIVVAGFGEGPGVNDPFSGPDNYDFLVARLDASGQLDTSFGAGGKVSIAFDLAGNGLDFASDVLIQNDGKIVVTGTVQSGTQDYDYAAVRLHPSGNLDTGFGSGGKVHIPFSPGFDPYDECMAAALQSDGKILLVGAANVGGSDDDFGILRLLPDGSLDPTFGSGGRKTVYFDLVPGGLDRGSGIALDTSGRILVAGTAIGASAYQTEFAVARLLPSGSYDTTFSYDGRVVVPINWGYGYDAGIDIAAAPNGKVLVAGRAYVQSADDANYAVVRLLPDGAVDTSFGSYGTAMVPFDLGQDDADVLQAMTVQLTGGIVVVGSVQRSATGDIDWGMARLVGEPFFTFP